MITLRSALPTPKEAWRRVSQFVRYVTSFDTTLITENIFERYAQAWEDKFKIDKDYFYNDYILPCIKIYGE